LTYYAAAAGDEDDVTLTFAVRAQALRELRQDGPRTLVVPLATPVGDSDAIDVAVDLREQLGIADQDADARRPLGEPPRGPLARCPQRRERASGLRFQALERRRRGGWHGRRC
jgi:hypothetical protein